MFSHLLLSSTLPKCTFNAVLNFTLPCLASWCWPIFILKIVFSYKIHNFTFKIHKSVPNHRWDTQKAKPCPQYKILILLPNIDWPSPRKYWSFFSNVDWPHHEFFMVTCINEYLNFEHTRKIEFTRLLPTIFTSSSLILCFAIHCSPLSYPNVRSTQQ